MQVSASSLAQKITLSKSNAPLKSIFKELKAQSGYNFFYTDDLLENASAVTINVRNFELIDVLNLLFEGQNLDYLIRDKTVIVKAGSTPKQDIISGFVGDKKDRKPLPGVTVTIKGTKSLVQTDKNGKFTISVAGGAKTLEFRYIGYKTVEIPITVNANYTIYMEEDQQSLKETVITGMSERKTSTFTGAAKTITGTELKTISSNNVFAAVAALDPSFRIVPNNLTGGDINALPDIQIRGQNSFPNLGAELSGNPNSPLFILDNFEVPLQRIVDLDINRIASITLLKDASATSIYGSRGANGVMVVTTIVPTAGKIQVDFTNDFSFTTPDLSVYDLLDSREKLDFEQRVGIYNNYLGEVLYNERYKAMSSGVNTNWLTLPVQNGYRNRTSLSLGGGDQAIRYSMQFSGDMQTGVMKGQDNNRYSGNFSIFYTVKKVRFSNMINLTQANSNASPYGSFSDYVGMNPYWAPYNSDGSIKPLLENIVITPAERSVITNPLMDVSYNTIDNRTESFNVSNNTTLRYDPSKSLFFEASFNLQKTNGTTDNFYSALDSRFINVTDIAKKGTYTVRNDKGLSMQGRLSGTLNKVFGPHQIFSTLQVENRDNKTSYYQMNTEGFPFDRLDNLLFATQYQANSKPLGDEGTVRTLGLTFSGNYSYNSRYFADVSVRRDGSSQFGSNKRFGTFWSTGLGWNIHNEKFLKNSKVIDRLRLRGSYGSTGSLNIPAYSSQFRYSFGLNTSYYGDLGAVLDGLGNSDLSWQQNLKGNLGLEATLWNDRLNLRTEIYREITQNALTSISLAPSTGFSLYSENLGKLQNTGVEIDLRYRILNDRQRGMIWNVSINGFSNKNILKELSNKLKASNERLNTTNINQTAPNPQFQEGHSMNTIYVVQSMGIDPVTGQEVYLTRDGQKTFIWDAADKVAYGDTNPKWNGSFATDFTYGGFNVGLNFGYNYGGQLYNSTLLSRVESVNARNNVDRRAYELGWKGPGDVSRYRRITTSPTQTKNTSRFVQDDNYLNLNSARVSYNFFKSAFVKKMGLTSLMVSAITNDIFRASTIQIERGTSNPFARTYSLTVRAGF